MWKSNIGKVVEEDFDPAILQSIKSAARVQCGQMGGIDKDALFIAEWLAQAWNDGKRSATLERLCTTILSFGTGSSVPATAVQSVATAA